MRKIYCEQCGDAVKPTHPDDAALGLAPRRIGGLAIKDLVCDACGHDISKGTEVVAESTPRNMREWEGEYLIQN